MSAMPAKAVVIGASAGALEALSIILPSLPRDYGLPVMVVVHISSDKKSLLTEIFRDKCDINVVEADDKEPIQGGTVYFAPPDYHMLVETKQRLSLSSDEPVLFSRPSVDVLFESAADAFGTGLIAVILSGANQDGAKGLQAVVQAGGRAIVQNPREAFAAAMPEAAMNLCPTARVLPLEDIALYLRAIEKV